MDIEKSHIYHIYNQGNNRQRVFFNHDNYILFLKKIKDYIIPHADILAWCLMPNHFHLMIYVHTQEIILLNANSLTPDFTNSLTPSEAISKKITKTPSDIRKIRTINDSIGLILRTYTRAINNQEKRSGSVFKSHTKAECVTKVNATTPSFFNSSFGAQINVRIPENEYPQVCFKYIHDNPVNAKLVTKPENWEFSSYMDYVGLRNGKLINRQRAKEFGLIFTDGLTSSETINNLK
jgi:putative transposase